MEPKPNSPKVNPSPNLSPNASPATGASLEINSNNATINNSQKQDKKLIILIIGMVVCAILALGGVGFGIWGILKQSNDTISDPNFSTNQDKDNEDNQNKNDGNATDDIKKDHNPIISATAPRYYQIGIASPRFGDQDAVYEASLGIENGKIVRCGLYTVNTKWVEDAEISGSVKSVKFAKDCQIEGISGKIYKPILAGAGHDPSMGNLAFIMEDGSVEYLPVQAMGKGDFTVKGKLKIDGFVVDAVEVAVGQHNTSGGYAATIFVLSDGRYVEYKDDMMQ